MKKCTVLVVFLIGGLVSCTSTAKTTKVNLEVNKSGKTNPDQVHQSKKADSGNENHHALVPLHKPATNKKK